jgi:hypothetical protein
MRAHPPAGDQAGPFFARYLMVGDAFGHICGGIDFDPRFCHAFSHEIGAPDRFWHAFGPFGPRPYGVSQKAISY